MQPQRPFWYLLNLYGWVVFGMSVITAFIIGQWWVVLVGIMGYLVAVFVDLIGGGSLGRTGAMRLARAEQENRELRAEQARLLGAIRERDARLAALGKASPEPLAPAPSNSPDSETKPSP